MSEKKHHQPSEEEINEAQPAAADAQVAEIEALQKRVEEAEAKARELEAKAAENLDGWQRAVAEFQNYKKRIDRDRESDKAIMKGDLIKRVLPVLDDLERALKNRPEDDAWTGGIELIQRKLQQILASEGLKRIEAEGTPDAATVTGRVHVLRARYTANVDLEHGLLEARRPPPPPRPYDRAGEWLRFDLQIVVDGDVKVENDLVAGDVRGELTLTGTLAAPGLVGALSLAEGSRVRFRGNEFALTHAVLDFSERNRIEIALDVHGQSQVRDYQIFMHAFGPLSDPQLTLTSTPALSQPDIITLLSIGYTRRDATAGRGVQGVATAAAAQALFSASGLDEQVKRFLPRGDVVRDFSVRITSEWSESSGQVEPRAELESWLLKDKVRLRYQAPLTGTRGQKAQAELKLGSHTALQYQWDNDNPDVPAGDHGLG